MKLDTSLFVIICFSLILFPVVSAGSLSDSWDEFRGLFGLGTFYQGQHSAGYSLVESDKVLLRPGDRECLYASANEQIEFSWYLAVSSSPTYVNGLIKGGDSECISFPNDAISLSWKRYSKDGSTDLGNHKTQVYRCSAHKWVSWGYFDEDYGSSLGNVWCPNKLDKGWLDFDGKFHCAIISDSSWCTNRKDAYWCMKEQNGRVSSDMCNTEKDYLEGALISRLDDGSYCCVSRSQLGDDPASWYEVASNTDGNPWAFIDDVAGSIGITNVLEDFKTWLIWGVIIILGFFLLPYILPTFLKWLNMIRGIF